MIGVGAQVKFYKQQTYILISYEYKYDKTLVAIHSTETNIPLVAFETPVPLVAALEVSGFLS